MDFAGGRLTEIPDEDKFKVLLVKGKYASGKTYEDLCREIGTYPKHWHIGTSLPKEESLPKVAQAYGIDLEELTAAYQLAKAQRKREKEAKRNPRAKVRGRAESDMYGTIERRDVLSRTNSQLPQSRFGKY